MKQSLKLFLLACMSVMLWSCEYDDSALWNKVDEMDDRLEALEEKVAAMNKDISAIQEIVNAVQNGKFITKVEQTADGFRLVFSDNTSIELKHGKNGSNGSDGANGRDGSDAPVIGVKEDVDGRYYWTQTGNGKTEWLLDANGNKIPVTGENGSAGVTPILGIDAEGYWTVDTGNGPERILDANGDPVRAVPDQENSLFTGYDEDEDSITLTLANGTSITLPKVSSLSTAFVEGDNQQIKVGETKDFALTSVNLDYCKVLDITEGWNAELSYTQVKAISDVVIRITAPATLTDANRNCEIHIIVSDEAGNCKISKLHLTCVEFYLRTLTFEDVDAKFTPFELEYCSTQITTWSDLIDDLQYGGELLYGDYSTSEYTWWDEGNTELMHTFPYNYNAYCYWGGGHAISNYNTKDYTTYGDFNNQLTVYNGAASDDMNTTGGGHNGSDNFAMHYGYIDGSAYNQTEYLPSLVFADGIARVIDHMYVNNSTYAISCYCDGNGLTAAIGPDDWVKLIAVGYDADENKIGEVSMYLCNGPDNIVTEWTKFDLSSLGEVVKVEFNITGSSDNGYGFSQPAYFAYDDVCVRF